MLGEFLEKTIECRDGLRTIQDARLGDFKRAVIGTEILRGESNAIVIKEKNSRVGFFLDDNFAQRFGDGAIRGFVAGEAGTDIAVEKPLAHFLEHPIKLVELDRGDMKQLTVWAFFLNCVGKVNRVAMCFGRRGNGPDMTPRGTMFNHQVDAVAKEV